MTDAIKSTEVALSHPSVPSAIRILNDGRIAITAGEEDGAGIIINPEDGSITLYGARLDFVFDEVFIDGIPVAKEVVMSHDMEEWNDALSPGSIRAKIKETESDRS